MAEIPPPMPAPIPEDRPPFFRSWNGMYLLVLATLAALVALFTLLSWRYGGYR